MAAVISYTVFFGGMLSLAIGLYYSLRLVKLI